MCVTFKRQNLPPILLFQPMCTSQQWWIFGTSDRPLSDWHLGIGVAKFYPSHRHWCRLQQWWEAEDYQCPFGHKDLFDFSICILILWRPDSDRLLSCVHDLLIYNWCPLYPSLCECRSSTIVCIVLPTAFVSRQLKSLVQRRLVLLRFGKRSSGGGNGYWFVWMASVKPVKKSPQM